MTTKTRKAPIKAIAAVLPSMYIGPTIPKTGLQNGVILNNGLPKDVLSHTEKCPEIEKLVVTMDVAAEARQKIILQGTSEHKFYTKVTDYLAGSEQ